MMVTVKQLVEFLEEDEDKPLRIKLPSGDVPKNFHVTEVGRVCRKFIDCGGTVREWESCLIQVWVACDVDHRLESKKLLKIIKMADESIGLDDLLVSFEYGEEVASNYNLAILEKDEHGLVFVLMNKVITCLAPDKCGVPSFEKSGCCGEDGCC
jgi:hypothetical protein